MPDPLRFETRDGETWVVVDGFELRLGPKEEVSEAMAGYLEAEDYEER